MRSPLLRFFILSFVIAVLSGCTYSASKSMLPETKVSMDMAYIYGNFETCYSRDTYLTDVDHMKPNFALELSDESSGEEIRIQFGYESPLPGAKVKDISDHKNCSMVNRWDMYKEWGFFIDKQTDKQAKKGVYASKMMAFERKNSKVSTFSVIPVKPGEYRLISLVYLKGEKEHQRKELDALKSVPAFKLSAGQAVYIGNWLAGGRLSGYGPVDVAWEFHGLENEFVRATHLLNNHFPQCKPLEKVNGLK